MTYFHEFNVDKVEKFLKVNRRVILWGMVAVSVVNVIVRFWGSWEYFFGVLIVQFLCWQGIRSYLYGGNISSIGAVMLDSDSGKARLCASVAMFICYLATFLFKG
jgi:hypothetical protein